MKEALVSIVIPAYNHARHLKEAIDSVLAQDYGAIELIVLDDGSTDHTPEVLAQYSGRFYHERHINMGQAATLNKGWSIANGQFLAYLSADDVLMPGAVRYAVEYLEREPKAVLAYCDFTLIDAESNKIRTVRAPEYDYAQMVIEGVCAPGPGAFFRKSAFVTIGGWNVRLRQVPDYECWLRLGLQGPFVHIPEVLASFRVHDNSQTFSKTTIAGAEEILNVIEMYFERSDIPGEIALKKDAALAYAHLSVAQLHLRAGRYTNACTEMKKVWVHSPMTFFSQRSLRMLLNGLFNRLGHRVLRALR